MTHNQNSKLDNNVDFFYKLSKHFWKTQKKLKSCIIKIQNSTIMQIFSTNYQNTFKKQKYHAFSFSKFDNQHLFLPIDPFHTAIRRTFSYICERIGEYQRPFREHSQTIGEHSANIPRTFREHSRILANICEQSGEYSCVMTANILEQLANIPRKFENTGEYMRTIRRIFMCDHGEHSRILANNM